MFQARPGRRLRPVEGRGWALQVEEVTFVKAWRPGWSYNTTRLERRQPVRVQGNSVSYHRMLPTAYVAREIESTTALFSTYSVPGSMRLWGDDIVRRPQRPCPGLRLHGGKMQKSDINHSHFSKMVITMVRHVALASYLKSSSLFLSGLSHGFRCLYAFPGSQHYSLRGLGLEGPAQPGPGSGHTLRPLSSCLPPPAT